MFETERAVGYYMDVFGNEVTEYERKAQYTVRYKGCVFEGDSQDNNSFDTDSWDKAIAFYHQYKDSCCVSIKDNQYDVTFENGDWS